jgi:hypothetical protein
VVPSVAVQPRAGGRPCRATPGTGISYSLLASSLLVTDRLINYNCGYCAPSLSIAVSRRHPSQEIMSPHDTRITVSPTRTALWLPRVATYRYLARRTCHHYHWNRTSDTGTGRCTQRSLRSETLSASPTWSSRLVLRQAKPGRTPPLCARIARLDDVGLVLFITRRRLKL